MFHAAMSAGSIGLPRFGPSASALPAINVVSPHNSNKLRIYMAHLSLRIHGPAHDSVEVVIGKTKHGWNRRQLAPRRNKLRARGLRISVLIPGSALQNRGASAPAPWHPEPREGHAQHRLLQRGFSPTQATVRRHHDF